MCPTCKTFKLIGKSTQRYCSIECKNEHHRLARLMIKPYQIQKKRLRRNLIVLFGIMGDKTKSLVISEDLLFEFGFDFRALSGSKMRNKKKYSVIFCFEFRRIGHGKVLICRTNQKEKVQLVESFLNRWRIDFPENLEMLGGTLRNGIVIYFQRLSNYIDNWLTVKQPDSKVWNHLPST